jgi:hypothetical protein
MNEQDGRKMKAAIWFCALAIATCNLSRAGAAITITMGGDTGAAPAGWVSNDLFAHSDYDLLSAAIFITLDSGVVYNNNVFVAGYETFQQSPGETYVTLNNSPSTSIAGSAGDLGHYPPVSGEAEFGPSVLGAAWFSTSTNDAGNGLPLGTFSFSADANGAGMLRVSSKPQFSSQQPIILLMPVSVENGVLLPEPASLGLLGLGGLFLLRRGG